MQKKVLLLILVPFLITISCKNLSDIESNNARPNVLLIMTDDQGYGDFGFTGNHQIQTPNLDKLAAESTMLSNFYVSPVCAPTRASLMTGKFALRTGIYDTFNGGALMASKEVTIAEILRNNGYETAIFGKWHLGSGYTFRPSDQGFEESLIHHGGGIGQYGDPENYFDQDSCYFDPILFRNNEKIQTTGYCSDVFSEAAIEFIDTKRENPFFIYLSFNAPHSPLQVPKEWYDQYRPLNFDESEALETGTIHPPMNEWEKENARRVYAMVSNIDYNIGRIMQSLKTQEKLDNTLIIFLSDNGPMSKRFNAGLRALKSSTYDGGVKSPCILRYPGTFEKGSTIETVTAHIDLLPTIIDFCGIDLPEALDIDGKSMLPLVNGEQQEAFMDRNIYEQWGRQFPERYKNISVRKGFYKLIGNASYDANLADFELYETNADPFETNNIAAENLELVNQLKSELDEWFSQEVIENGNPKRQFLVLDPDQEEKLILTRNEAKGPPEIWWNDNQYGYWDVDVVKSGYYDIKIQFRDKAFKEGHLFVKQQPLQYSKFNQDTTARTLSLEHLYLKKGKGILDVFYKTGWNEVMLPLTVELTKSEE